MPLGGVLLLASKRCPRIKPHHSGKPHGRKRLYF
jgi:hypothetical protein